MDFYKGIFGDEFADQIFGKDSPKLPTAVGVLPNKRPAGTTPSARRKEIKELIEQSLAQQNYNQEVLDSLADAVAAYTENCIGGQE